MNDHDRGFDMTPGSLLRHFRVFGFVTQYGERLLGGLTRAEFSDWLRRRAICDVSGAELERVERNVQSMPQGLREFLAPHYPSLRETAPQDLHAIRESLGWSQDRLALELDMSRSAIAMAESGTRPLPVEAAARLAKTVTIRESGTEVSGYSICDNQVPCFKGFAMGEKGGSLTSFSTPEAAWMKP